MSLSHSVHRELWPEGPKVSPLGLGTWGLGGIAYGPIEDSEALAVITQAVEQGISFIDTSDLYGDGRAERLVGQACLGRRDRLVIATKGGMLPHSGLRERQDFSVRHLDGALNRSLRRLCMDHVDLYMLHSPPVDILPGNEALFRFLEETRRSGRARGIGISAKSPADAVAALDLYSFDVVEINFNLIDQRALDEGLLDRLQRTGHKAIARTPFCFGFLTGAVSAETRFASGDHRANWPPDQLRRWSRAPAVFRPVADARGQSLSALALNFCLAPAAIACAIPGMMNVAEVRANLAALAYPPLTAAELAELRQLYAEVEFFDRSARTRGRQ